jgi:hypothetical protein
MWRTEAAARRREPVIQRHRLRETCQQTAVDLNSELTSQFLQHMEDHVSRLLLATRQQQWRGLLVEWIAITSPEGVEALKKSAASRRGPAPGVGFLWSRLSKMDR